MGLVPSAHKCVSQLLRFFYVLRSKQCHFYTKLSIYFREKIVHFSIKQRIKSFENEV